MDGQALGILALALCTILCGIGSGFGLKFTGTAVAGVLTEDASKSSKVMVLALLPATQGIYGLLISFMGIASLPAAGSEAALGWNLFFAVLPMTIVGLVSAILQAQTSVSAIKAVGKKGELSGKLMMYPAMVETYALLALVVSILLLNIL